MKKKVLTLALAAGLTGAFTLNAVPAKRGVRDIAQPDGTTVKAELFGDEYFHYYLSEDGLPLVQDQDGSMRYASVDSKGKLVLSPMRAENAPKRSAAARAFTDGVDTDAVIEALYRRASGEGRMKAVAQNGMGLFSGNFPRTGDIPALVFLVEYKDVKFTHPNPSQYFGDMINKEGFNEYGGTGSANEYFIQQSGGKFRPKFDVYGPVTLPENRSYYGGNNYYGSDNAPEDMLVHAAKLLDGEVDFSKYDLDNDGKVDNVFIFYAGQGEASYGSSETVWPHSWELSAAGKAFSLDGKIIDRYACTNEWEQTRPDGVGTFIHEFSHVMGLPDLYHTSNSGAAYTPGSWSVMDYGPYNNDGCTPPNYSIYERNAMGWLEPELLDGPAGISLEEIGKSNRGCIIQTEKETEFFLLENRQQTGWDAYIPGHGMLIWHVDFVQNVFDRNVVNNSQSHQYVDIVEAGGVANSTNESTMASYSWPGTRNKTAFTSSTSPALKSWAGKAIDMPITDIAESTDGIISFKVAGGPIDLGVAGNVKAEGHDNGTASLSWDEVEFAKGYRLNLYTKDGMGNPEHYALKDQYCTGTSYTADRLLSDVKYYFTVTATAGTSAGEASEEVSFDMPELAWDYMIPQISEATGISESGFTAHWTKVNGAVSYILDVEVEIGDGERTDTYGFGSNNTLEIPEGWDWSGSSSDMYGSNSIGYFGTAAPALKFRTNGQTLTSAVMNFPIGKIEFWERGASSNAGNRLSVEGRATTDSDWESIFDISPTTNSKGETVTVDAIPETVRQIRFVFTKIGGNLAFDDLKIHTIASKTVPLEGYTDKNVGDTDSHAVTTSGINAGTWYYTVRAVNAAGKESLASNRCAVSAQASGITDAATTARGISVNGRTIVYTGSAGDFVRVCNAGGMTAASAIADGSGHATVELPSPGLYIVAVPTGASKIFVK